MDILKKLAEEFKLNAWQVEKHCEAKLTRGILSHLFRGTEKKPPVSLTMKYSAT